MTTAVLNASNIFLRGKDRNFTAEEWEELSEQMGQAYRRGDVDEVRRIGRMIPADPNIAKAFKEVYGKEALLAGNFDLTEANRKWGEGWLNGPNDAE